VTGFSTRAIHGDILTDKSYRKDVHGSLRMPVYDSVAFEYQSSKDLQLAFDGPFSLLAKLRCEVFRNLGACLSPHTAYLQSLGLETMSLRIDKSCANALEIARFLETHPVVTSVQYPGLKSSRFHENAVAQFGNKFGGLLTFELGDRDECFRFMDNLRIIRRATNLNDNKTLVLHPASTIFCEFTEEQKKRMAISDTMERLAVGIEDPEDIIGDINQALKTI